MPNRVRVLVVRAEDKGELERRAHSATDPVRLVLRARIVLLSAQGLPGRAIAERLGCSEPTVVAWRRRYAARGLAGLDDAARLGGPVWVMTPEVRAQVLAETVASPPEGDAPWSARRLAHRMGVRHGLHLSHDSIAALWRRCCLDRDPDAGFMFRTDPALAVTIHDLVGLYIGPPWAAAVVRTDTSTSASPEGPPGTTGDVLGALEDVVAVRSSTPERSPRDLEPFIADLAAAYPHGRLHVIQQAAEHHPTLSAVLVDHPRIQVHTTRADCSWPTLVHCLHTLTGRRAGGGTMAVLARALRAHVADRVPGSGPFTWIGAGGPDGPLDGRSESHGV